MKRFVITLLLITTIIVVSKSQSLYEIGLHHFQNGEYTIADSLFSLYLKQYTKDIDAHFNYATVKLLLKDTCTYCNEMYNICHYSNDQDACKLYNNNCGHTDTLFYDNNYMRTSKDSARYVELIRSHKFNNYKTVFLHDKSSRYTHFLKFNDYDATAPIQEDIIAIYRLYNDKNIVFLFTLTPPRFPNNGVDQTEYREKSPFILQARKVLNLDNVLVTIEYIVDKTGSTKDVKLVSVNSAIEQMEELKKYINLIVLGMPKRKPAKYQNENVDYLVEDYISF